MNESDDRPDNLLDALIISILDDFTLEERVSIADLKPHELKTLQLVMGKYMKFRLEQLNEQGNSELLKECRERSGDDSLDDDGAASFILKEIEKYSHKANLEEIQENDYNLNIPRYVDTFEEEEPVDIEATKANIAKIESELVKVKVKMNEYLKELGL